MVATARTIKLLEAAAAGAAAESNAATAAAASAASSTTSAPASGTKLSVEGQRTPNESKKERKLHQRQRAALLTVRQMAQEESNNHRNTGSSDPYTGHTLTGAVSSTSSGAAASEPAASFGSAESDPYTACLAMLAERRAKLAGWLEREQAKHWSRVSDPLDKPYPVPFFAPQVDESAESSPSTTANSGANKNGGGDSKTTIAAEAAASAVPVPLTTSDLLKRCDSDASVVKMSRKVFLFTNRANGAATSKEGEVSGESNAEALQPLSKKARSTTDAEEVQSSAAVAASNSLAAPNAAAMGVNKKSSTQVGSHPFLTEYGDHFETPLEAYAHVAPALMLLAEKLKVPIAKLRIYDPFYCAGEYTSENAILCAVMNNLFSLL